MKRDKIISVRVDSSLFDQVQKIIDSRTTISHYEHRTYYIYRDENGKYHNKYTIADLLEKAMKEYIEKLSAVKK